MSPEVQAEYDALPWHWLTWTEEDDTEAFNAGAIAMTCVECGDVIEVGEDAVEKYGSIDIWHARHAPDLARKAHPDYLIAEAWET